MDNQLKKILGLKNIEIEFVLDNKKPYLRFLHRAYVNIPINNEVFNEIFNDIQKIDKFIKKETKKAIKKLKESVK